MIVIGIDPGLDGGYVELVDVELSSQSRIVYKGRLYTDRAIDRLQDRQWDVCHVFMERAQVMARDGGPRSARSMFNYGQAFGEILGQLGALRIPFTLVRPADWSRQMHAGTKLADTKQRSLEAARRIFPGVDWRPTPACTKPHDGIFEAALIAEYGRRKLQGDEA